MTTMEDTMKNDETADSPTSVLEDEEMCKPEVITSVEANIQENGEDASVAFDEVEDGKLAYVEGEEKDGFGVADDGDSSLLPSSMAKEEEKLQEARKQEELEKKKTDDAETPVDATHFSKLDELLTKTQLYTQFLFENMEGVTSNEVDNQSGEIDAGGKKRGRKRKAAAQYNTRKARKAVEAMLTRSQEGTSVEDADLTEEERTGKEQAELIPLLTGGKLKPYQLKGVKWLISLWQNGLNGILADQMGLGKTIQTIGFLAHLKGKGLHGPYLVVAPLSTLSNWVNEITRFAPSIKAVIYHGSKNERQQIQQKRMPRTIGLDFPVVVTSYEILLSDAKALSHYSWKYVVVDEGHRLKNAQCKLLREMKRLPIENKLLLTGTPLQNNLAELWALLNFILPDIFSSHEEFESWFDLSAKCSDDVGEEELKEKRVQMISKLHLILRPFLLRRMKEDVEQMLPRKKEIILYANMTEHQKQLQDHLVNKNLEDYLFEKSEHFCRPGMRQRITNLVIQLRKNCNHPDLLEAPFNMSFTYPPVEELVKQCGKFQLLDRLLNRLLARKHKVLIFSQWTKVLDLIEYCFSEKGLEVCRIDGSIKLDERERQIREFNDLNSNISVFLLSTRAGGLGINLTAADTCIIYDSDWNPQMDLQAMDRCHRIGQTRPVHVYRLSTSHSVEGRMLKRAFGKLKLEHLVIGKGQFQQERNKSNTLEASELLALLRDEEDEEDKRIQTDISDENLEKVLDRGDLIVRTVDDTSKAQSSVSFLPLKGPGWEVVIPVKSGGGMLSSVNG